MTKQAFVVVATFTLALAAGSALAGSKLGVGPDGIGTGQVAGGKLGGGMDKADGDRRGG